MAADAQTSELIETTVSSLSTGGVTSLIPTEAPGLIDNWLDTLGDEANVRQVRTSLEELRSQLDSGYPDPMTVRTIMLDLADQLNVIATNHQDPVLREQLRPLSEVLLNFGNAL